MFVTRYRLIVAAIHVLLSGFFLNRVAFLLEILPTCGLAPRDTFLDFHLASRCMHIYM